jgi:hypothetical protein
MLKPGTVLHASPFFLAMDKTFYFAVFERPRLTASALPSASSLP